MPTSVLLLLCNIILCLTVLEKGKYTEILPALFRCLGKENPALIFSSLHTQYVNSNSYLNLITGIFSDKPSRHLKLKSMQKF